MGRGTFHVVPSHPHHLTPTPHRVCCLRISCSESQHPPRLLSAEGSCAATRCSERCRSQAPAACRAASTSRCQEMLCRVFQFREMQRHAFSGPGNAVACSWCPGRGNALACFPGPAKDLHARTLSLLQPLTSPPHAPSGMEAPQSWRRLAPERARRRGTLSRAEKTAGVQENYLRDTFASVADVGGRMGSDELATALKRAGLKPTQAQLAAVWERMDTNRDGRATLLDFVRECGSVVAAAAFPRRECSLGLAVPIPLLFFSVLTPDKDCSKRPAPPPPPPPHRFSLLISSLKLCGPIVYAPCEGPSSVQRNVHPPPLLLFWFSHVSETVIEKLRTRHLVPPLTSGKRSHLGQIRSGPVRSTELD